jgi:catechol 2,3-dioxygenase-like lactoylglutathione lyase family enzyme
MKFEHAALNVPDAKAMAAWWIEHCEMRNVRAEDGPPFFLADASGRTILELYSNEAAPIPDYAAQHHLSLHIAFAVENADATRDRLIAAGATLVSDAQRPDGIRLVMLRDPWGVALQLVKRKTPLP